MALAICALVTCLIHHRGFTVLPVGGLLNGSLIFRLSRSTERRSPSDFASCESQNAIGNLALSPLKSASPDTGRKSNR